METITLTKPIDRATPITEVQLRRPNSGELRGLNLANVLQLDVDALHTLLPRITLPALTKSEISDLDPADLVQLGAGVSRFFLPPEEQM